MYEQKHVFDICSLFNHPVFFVKLDFEIAVDQQTKAHDQSFEGVPDSGYPPVPTGQPRPYLVNFWLNFAKSPQHAQTDKNWIKIG